jgi:hypothetical protein
MNLLYTDETNIDPKSAEFFVYAGTMIPGNSAATLSTTIDAIRKQYGYKPNEILKFNTVERPNHITPEAHRLIKQDLLRACATYDVKMFASVVSHSIARSPEEARRNEINRIALHFDYHLRSIADHGIMLIDTFQDKSLAQRLREVFGSGLSGLPYGSYRLKQILGFHLASIGSSNFCSVIDIALGALRFAINNRNDSSKTTTVRNLLALLSPMFVRHDDGRVSEVSFFFSPRKIRVVKYLDHYLALNTFLRTNGIDCVQTPGR